MRAGHACDTSYDGSTGRRTTSEAGPGNSRRPYLKKKLKVKGLGASWLKR
jgi:hypothetical protein